MSETGCVPNPHDSSAPNHDGRLHARIRAEFQEMPGMRLTLTQAARLFNLERAQCALALQALVDSGALCTNGREYVGQDVGRRCA